MRVKIIEVKDVITIETDPYITYIETTYVNVIKVDIDELGKMVHIIHFEYISPDGKTQLGEKSIYISLDEHKIKSIEVLAGN